MTYRGYIREIRRFTTSDGRGIRTIMYTLGCNLRCAWCSSPLTWQCGRQIFRNPEICNHCARCVSSCPNNRYYLKEKLVHTDSTKKCDLCLKCVYTCPKHAITLVGRSITCSEALDILLRDRFFYEETGGGVTISGGEPLCQFDFVAGIVKGLLENSIPVSIETNLSCEWESLSKLALPGVCFHADLKHMNPDTHRILTGRDNSLIHDNMRKLKTSPADLRIGFPCIPGVNDSVDNISRMISFLQELRICEVYIFPLHKLGLIEYNGIGFYEMADRINRYPLCSKELLIRIAQQFTQAGIRPEIEGMNIS